jgi:hypothetical protein
VPVAFARVSGMRATENRSISTSATVRLTPSTATEPLATISSRNRFGGRIHTRREAPCSSSTLVTLPIASVCPWTR